jgi:hypothetical protein
MISFQEATERLKQAATAAAAAVAQGGKLASVRHDSVMSLGNVELKRLMPGSLMILTDDSLALVTIARGVLEARDTHALSFSVRTSLSGSATVRDEGWMTANVKLIALGKLSFGGQGGAEAGKLQYMGVPVTVSVDSGEPFGLTTATDASPQAKTLAEVNALVDMGWRSWRGGISPPHSFKTRASGDGRRRPEWPCHCRG